jgi:hypothetical protein
MAESRNSFFSKLAAGIDSDGDITAAAIPTQVLLQAGALDSAAVINLVDSDYVSARAPAGGGGGGASAGTAIAMSLIFG